MRHFFYTFRVGLLYWCLVCFFPFAVHAKPTGEIIFIHPEMFELWVTHIEDTRNAHMIFRREEEVIEKLSVQKGGSLLVIVAYSEQLQANVFLLDRSRVRLKEINLTQGRYDGVFDAAISINGDVVFTTGYTEPPKARGLYLIRNDQLHHRIPKVTLLKQVSAFGVEWSPNGKDIAYSTDRDVFLGTNLPPSGENSSNRTYSKKIHSSANRIVLQFPFGSRFLLPNTFRSLFALHNLSNFRLRRFCTPSAQNRRYLKTYHTIDVQLSKI